MKRVVSTIFVCLILVGCGRPPAAPLVSLDALPLEVRREAEDIPSLCLIAKDPSGKLMFETKDSSGQTDGGFLTMPVVPGEFGYALAPGVDSIAVSGSAYIVVGCDPGADMAVITKQAFADAERRNVKIELWVKTKSAWVRQQ